MTIADRLQVISRDESYRRVVNEYKSRHDFYFLDYDGEEVIDAGMKGNPARFANHSCGPNCKMIRFRLADADEWQIGLFAAKDIKAGSELTYDYGWVTCECPFSLRWKKLIAVQSRVWQMQKKAKKLS